MYPTIFRTLLAALLATMPPTLMAQTYLETYGQNRIQYRTFEWRYFETEHFKVYHYDAAGRMLARYVAEQSESDIKLIEDKLGGRFPKQLKIVLYNNYDHYRQTNIGKKSEEALLDNPAGTLDLVGDVLTVYFTGVHTDLRRQLQNGMAQVVMKQMLFGNDMRDVLRNAVVQNLPEWLTNGFTDYVIQGWDANANDEWRNLLEAYPKLNYYQLADLHPTIAGRAFWKYIADKYSKDQANTLMLSMQQKGNLSTALKSFAGVKNMTVVFNQATEYFRNIYATDTARRTSLTTEKPLYEFPIPKDGTVITNIKVSPHGADVAYVEWKDGEYKVILVRTGDVIKRDVLLTGGRSNFNDKPDPNYPILCWNNTGFKLGILYRKGESTKLRIYNSLRSKIENYTIPPNRFERVLGMTFLADDQQLLFSALKRSQSDLYEFTIKGNKMRNITNDVWDDLEPVYVRDGSRKGVLFLSNRPQPNLNSPAKVSELPNKPLNIFFYNSTTKDAALQQLTAVKAGHISQPVQYGPDNYAYLYDIEGIRNKYAILFGRTYNNLDSPISVPLTNYERNIHSHQFNPASQKAAEVIKVGKQYKVFIRPVKVPDITDAPIHIQRSVLYEYPSANEMPSAALTRSSDENISQPKKQDLSERNAVSTPQKGNKEKVFQSEFDDTLVNINLRNLEPQKEQNGVAPTPTLAVDSLLQIPTQLPDSEYVKMRAQPYRLMFRPDFFSLRLDNAVLYNRYQSLDETGGYFVNNNLGGMITMSLHDVMEDYRFIGGFRFPTNLSGLSYFLGYDNFRRRTDWGLLFVRIENFVGMQVQYIDTTRGIGLVRDELAKKSSTMIQANVNYPLDRVKSVRLQMSLREDKLSFKTTDALNIQIPISRSYYAMSRAEYVFDNTKVRLLNIRNGFRYKFYGEYFYGLNNKKGGFYNAGLDFRFYQRLYRQSIFATRLAAAHSDGNRKVVYLAGGVDNALNGQWSSLPLNQSDDYAFQAMATGIRGYEQNARNGNTFAIWNNELRIPIAQTFFKRPINNVIIRHLQLVPFLDIGSAWKGLSYNEDAFSKDVFVYNPPNLVQLKIVVPGNSGFAVGYGAGLRTMLFGYFFRTDVAWNIDDRRRKPMLHIGLGTDF